MSSEMPITLLHDAAGTPCVSMADAQRIAALIAADPAQPFDFASSCGYRTELMVGRMLEAGVPAAAVARIYQSVPEGSEAVMSVPGDGTDRGSFRRLLGLPAGTDSGVYALPGKDLKVVFQGGDRILVQNGDGTKGWDKREAGKGYSMHAENTPWRGGNHITGALYVLDPETNRAQLMVVDPHLAKDGALMTAPQWKQAVNCEDSVVMAGRIGEKPQILTECLSDAQRERYDAAVEAATDGAGGALSRGQYNQVIKAMFALDNDRMAERYGNFTGCNIQKFGAMPELAGFGAREDADGKRSDFRVNTDWDSLAPDAQVGLLHRWVSELQPLRDLQDVWRGRFPAGMPEPETKADPAPVPRSRVG